MKEMSSSLGEISYSIKVQWCDLILQYWSLTQTKDTWFCCFMIVAIDYFPVQFSSWLLTLHLLTDCCSHVIFVLKITNRFFDFWVLVSWLFKLLIYFDNLWIGYLISGFGYVFLFICLLFELLILLSWISHNHHQFRKHYYFIPVEKRSKWLQKFMFFGHI